MMVILVFANLLSCSLSTTRREISTLLLLTFNTVPGLAGTRQECRCMPSLLDNYLRAWSQIPSTTIFDFDIRYTSKKR